MSSKYFNKIIDVRRLNENNYHNRSENRYGKYYYEYIVTNT